MLGGKTVTSCNSGQDLTRIISTETNVKSLSGTKNQDCTLSSYKDLLLGPIKKNLVN